MENINNFILNNIKPHHPSKIWGVKEYPLNGRPKSILIFKCPCCENYYRIPRHTTDYGFKKHIEKMIFFRGDKNHKELLKKLYGEEYSKNKIEQLLSKHKKIIEGA